MMRREHLVLDPRRFEQLRQPQRLIDRPRSQEHRPPCRLDPLNLIDDRPLLGLHCPEDQRLKLLADRRLVGGNRYHAQLVNLVQLARELIAVPVMPARFGYRRK